METNIFSQFDEFVFHNDIAVKAYFADKGELSEEEKSASIQEYLNRELNTTILNLFIPIINKDKPEKTRELFFRLNKYTEYLHAKALGFQYRKEILYACKRFIGILIKLGMLDVKVYNGMIKSEVYLDCYSLKDSQEAAVSHKGFIKGSKLNIENPNNFILGLYTHLKVLKAISPDTELSDFKKLFDESLNDIQINWTRTKNELAYFIKRLKTLDYINDNDYWQKSSSIFLIQNEPIDIKSGTTTFRNSAKDTTAKNQKYYDLILPE
jgi:hypothetical protein